MAATSSERAARPVSGVRRSTVNGNTVGIIL